MLSEYEQETFKAIERELDRSSESPSRQPAIASAAEACSSTVWWGIAAMFATLMCLGAGSTGAATACGTASLVAMARELASWPKPTPRRCGDGSRG
jgi:hypothetical protein